MLLLKNLLFTFAVPGTVAGYVPLWLAGHRAWPDPLSFALALPFFTAGGAIYAWCVWDFASFGRGTPAPIDPPKKLVVRGLYRWTRNPMYLGVLTVILAWVLLFRSMELVVYITFVASCFHSFVVLYEEAALERDFGDAYIAYKEAVSRWVPRLAAVPKKPARTAARGASRTGADRR